jgi:Ner family transcriptional regulator
MHPAQIKAELEMKGYTQADIAAQLKRAPSTVNYVIKGTGRSRLIENRIAVILGRPAHEVWPSRYSKDGKPIRARRRPVRLADAMSRMVAAGAAAKG